MVVLLLVVVVVVVVVVGKVREDINAAREEMKIAWAKANLFLTRRSIEGAKRALSPRL